MKQSFLILDPALLQSLLTLVPNYYNETISDKEYELQKYIANGVEIILLHKCTITNIIKKHSILKKNATGEKIYFLQEQFR